MATTPAKPVFAAMAYTDPKTGMLTGGAQQALAQWQTAISELQSQVAALQAQVAALQKGAAN
jgi:hypothetical protein